MGLECGTYGREEMCSWFWLGNLKARTTLKTRCDGRVICKIGTEEIGWEDITELMNCKRSVLYGLESTALYSQQPNQQLYPQQKSQRVKMMDSKLTPWCRIFKWSVHGYSAGQDITAVMVNKGSSVCEIWGSYSGDCFKFTVF